MIEIEDEFDVCPPRLTSSRVKCYRVYMRLPSRSNGWIRLHVIRVQKGYYRDKDRRKEYEDDDEQTVYIRTVPR